MRCLIAAVQATLVLAGLLLLAMPAGLACCADILELHGEDCCESASGDAMARSCCEGGETAIGGRSAHQGAPPALAIFQLPAARWANAQPRAGGEALSTQLPPDRDAYALHSVLLL